MISKISSSSLLNITIDIYSQNSWIFHKVYTVSNSLLADDSAVSSMLLHPYGNNVASFPSMYIFSSYIGSLQIPANGAVSIDIPSSVNINSISPNCFV